MENDLISRAKEEWRPVRGFEGIYEVSDLGGVRSVARKRIVVDNRRTYERHDRQIVMTRSRHYKGYRSITLTNYPAVKTLMLHRIVADAFIPNPQDKPFVNHKNGDKADNRVSNLEWCTGRENNLHAFRTGLARKVRPTACIEDGLTFYSVEEAARHYGVGPSQIYACCTGKQSICHGKHYEFMDAPAREGEGGNG